MYVTTVCCNMLRLCVTVCHLCVLQYANTVSLDTLQLTVVKMLTMMIGEPDL